MSETDAAIERTQGLAQSIAESAMRYRADRLARVHEIYLRKEADLRKAQGELRAVLTIRQEAIAVMAGLLPP